MWRWQNESILKAKPRKTQQKQIKNKVQNNGKVWKNNSNSNFGQKFKLKRGDEFWVFISEKARFDEVLSRYLKKKYSDKSKLRQPTDVEASACCHSFEYLKNRRNAKKLERSNTLHLFNRSRPADLSDLDKSRIHGLHVIGQHIDGGNQAFTLLSHGFVNAWGNTAAKRNAHEHKI